MRSEFRSIICRRIAIDDSKTDIRENVLDQDLAEIDAIMKKNAAKGYPLREMLVAVFQTEAFLEH